MIEASYTFSGWMSVKSHQSYLHIAKEEVFVGQISECLAATD